MPRKRTGYDAACYYDGKLLGRCTKADSDAYTLLMNACGGDAARVLREYAYFSPELRAILEKAALMQADRSRTGGMFHAPKSSPWGEVQSCETLCPGVFLVSTAIKDKQGGREPLKHDLQIVESIMTSLYLEPGVMNVLIELTLSQCDNALSRAFMQARASQWKRKKIKTVKDAMDEANVYLKYRRNNNDDNEETEINMVDNDNVDMDELDEFLSQFE